MMTASQAYAKVVLGKLKQDIERRISEAIERRELFFKLPLDGFPANLDLDDVLRALNMLGYQFVDVDDGVSVTIAFDFESHDRPRRKKGGH